jgi:hypothetical protein
MSGYTSLAIAAIAVILAVVTIVYLASPDGSLTPLYQYIP